MHFRTKYIRIITYKVWKPLMKFNWSLKHFQGFKIKMDLDFHFLSWRKKSEILSWNNSGREIEKDSSWKIEINHWFFLLFSQFLESTIRESEEIITNSVAFSWFKFLCLNKTSTKTKFNSEYYLQQIKILNEIIIAELKTLENQVIWVSCRTFGCHQINKLHKINRNFCLNFIIRWHSNDDHNF
jgi:hypothetical protein